MTDEMKVMEVLGSEEGTTLVAEFTKLYLKKYQPDLADNEDAAKLVALEIMKQYTNKSYPDGCDYNSCILTGLRESIEELKQADVEPPIPESIPPRPRSYSRYLDPEEVQWLVKYDPEVKAAAERFVKGFREIHPSSCNNMSDKMLIDSELELLYKLNRRYPPLVEEHNFTPSFLKQFDEGTPEEILIRFFDKYNPKKEKKTKAELQQEVKKNLIYGLIWLILLPPVGAYFLVKAYRTYSEISEL